MMNANLPSKCLAKREKKADETGMISAEEERGNLGIYAGYPVDIPRKDIPNSAPGFF